MKWVVIIKHENIFQYVLALLQQYRDEIAIKTNTIIFSRIKNIFVLILIIVIFSYCHLIIDKWARRACMKIGNINGSMIIKLNIS